MCEINGVLQPSGKCGEAEYCAGPNTPKDAVCGKKQLCTKKGIQDFFATLCFVAVAISES